MGKRKQIAFSVPEELYEEINDLREELFANRKFRNISEICRAALKKALEEARASRTYRNEGILDGKKIASSIPEDDKRYIARILDNNGPYKKWSRFDKIEELKNHFEYIKRYPIERLYPRLDNLRDNTKHPLHNWLEVEDKQVAGDRLSECMWSYCAGCFEGINEQYETEQTVT